jgi:hypothetical protein
MSLPLDTSALNASSQPCCTPRLTPCSKISKNQEKSEKYYKKLEKIPSILVKKFCKSASFGFLKFKFHQICTIFKSPS